MISWLIRRSDYEDVNEYLDDPEWLREQYVIRSKAASRIASQLDVREQRVRDALSDHSVYRLSSDPIGHDYDQDALRQLHRGSFLDHVSESVSAQQLAADYDVPEDVVAEHCRQHDVVVEEDHLRGGDDSAADVIDQYDIDPTQSVVETNSDDVGNVIDSLWTSAQTMFKTKTETETESSSTAKEKLRGVVEERYHPDDPRVPEAGTDEAIALADGADLLRVRTGTIEIQTLLDKIRGSQTEIEQIREVVVDLDGIDIEEGDEIVVDGQLIEEVADPESADLWLATDSSIARISRDSDPILGDRIEIRDDQLDSEMSIRPFLDRRQQARMLYQQLNRRAERLLEGAS